MTVSTPPLSVEELADWTLWSERRPEDHKALYRWRVPERVICGKVLRPEWGSKLHCVGMGYSDNEWWPDGSRWDGYQRTVAPGLEWRLALEGEGERIIWGGLNLADDPWSGNPPTVHDMTRYIGAPVYDVESFSIHSTWGERYGFADLNKLEAAWNSSATAKDKARIAELKAGFPTIHSEVVGCTAQAVAAATIMRMACGFPEGDKFSDWLFNNSETIAGVVLRGLGIAHDARGVALLSPISGGEGE